jgi:hypothetical protein
MGAFSRFDSSSISQDRCFLENSGLIEALETTNGKGNTGLCGFLGLTQSLTMDL